VKHGCRILEKGKEIKRQAIRNGKKETANEIV
jgi:hypothetical protein